MPWFAWVIISAIVMTGFIATAGAIFGPRAEATREAIDLLHKSNAASGGVADKLAAVEKRLEAIEKTLKDV